jgi:predicted nuclease with TOPRIM domain
MDRRWEQTFGGRRSDTFEVTPDTEASLRYKLMVAEARAETMERDRADLLEDYLDLQTLYEDARSRAESLGVENRKLKAQLEEAASHHGRLNAALDEAMGR